MTDKKIHRVSSLNKCWIFDLDGTIVKHNGYLIEGEDSFLEGAKEFLKSIPESDTIIILTSRKSDYCDITEKFLKEEGIRFNHIIYGMPFGERILINDDKPSGLITAFAINTQRDIFMKDEFIIDNEL